MYPDQTNRARPATRHRLACLLLVCAPACTWAETYNFVVQPILPPAQTIAAYTPLTDYLSEKTGDTIKLVAAANFLVYWETMKRDNDYDIIMDASHFTDFRVQKLGYQVIAKIPDKVSYTLVTNENQFILDPSELVGRKVATMASPSLGAIRLEQLYPNIMRQPVIVETANSTDAVEKVRSGEVAGAIIPTPMVGQYSFLNTVVTTEQVPHMGISVSKRVSAAAAARLKQAMLDAANTPEGQKMLAKIALPGFITANNNTYVGEAKLLDGVWGYEKR